MDLKEYLIEMGISQIRLSQMCGVSVATINNLCNHKKKTIIPIALRIEAMTEEIVDAETLVDSRYKKRLKLAKKYNKIRKK